MKVIQTQEFIKAKPEFYGHEENWRAKTLEMEWCLRATLAVTEVHYL